MLEDRQLPGLLLVLSLVVETKHCLVHDPCQKCDLLNLLGFWLSAQLVLKRNSNFCPKESDLLFFLLFSSHKLLDV
jgi:hypothetical protein